LIDENVHFRHTARLINALIKARKRYQLLLFPEERHSPRSLADRVFMEENIRDFFLEKLK
jgi:dipeptidyl-peptidase-4